MHPHQREILDSIDSSENLALALLEGLVNTNSFTTNVSGVNAVQSRIEGFLEKLGMKVRRTQIPERGDILIATIGNQERPIMLSGHADTVHPPDSSFQRFSREGDRLCGPGTVDMKGGLVVILWALHVLHQRGLLASIPCKVVINSAEEFATEHSAAVIEEQARGCRSALVFEWGRENDGIITRRKGISSFWLECHGKSAHSGNAHQRGANAVLEMAYAIQSISALTNYERGITTNVGMVKGGSVVNAVPDYALAQFEFRVGNAADYQEMMTKVWELAKQPAVPGCTRSIRQDTSMPPMTETDASNRLFETYAQFAPMVGLGSGKYPGIIGGASDANRTSGQGCPSIDGLGPAGDGAHTQNEYCEFSSLIKKTKQLALWLAEVGLAKSGGAPL